LGGECSPNVKNGNTSMILVRKTKRKRSLRKPRRKRIIDIKVELGLGSMKLVGLV
jgi:hypothetical protein